MSDYWASSGALSSSVSVPVAGTGYDQDLVRPPVAIIGLIVVTVAAAAALFVVPAGFANVAGYVVGGFGTSAAVITYRHFDLLRRRDPLYIGHPGIGPFVAVLLCSGIVLGVVHIFFALRTTSVK
jgi:hypothetical protein